MCYVVYHDWILSQSAASELLTLRRWNGPLYNKRIQLTMLYSKEDTERYVNILRKYGVRMYKKRFGTEDFILLKEGDFPETEMAEI